MLTKLELQEIRERNDRVCRERDYMSEDAHAIIWNDIPALLEYIEDLEEYCYIKNNLHEVGDLIDRTCEEGMDICARRLKELDELERASRREQLYKYVDEQVKQEANND